ncbi:hypothetical protein [Sulfurospirillum arcachonense]|uniref:hypothetical protein n=1 Tax=Sulfurospirillum arcachonense TaxID=57666 RepID=UPI000467FF4C|nr:hypothetical protein [Sulfurospirillum arcachonense]
MKLRKSIAVLAIIGATSLFATGISGVSTLVDQINNTKDAQVKSQLMKKLHDELSTMNQKDLPAAQEIVSKKLKMSKVTEK